MSHDIHLAFSHPSERSFATSEGQPLDRISVRDHVVEAEIGAFQAERGKDQRIRFNIVVEVVRQDAQLQDDVDKILSYDKVTEAVEAELSTARLNLLETLAERVADRILTEPQAARVFVRIEKLDRGPFALGVEIVRARALQMVDVQQDAPRPRLVVLSESAVDTPHLSHWIDQLAASEVPTIFCVARRAVHPPVSQATPAQRRIELLALEQAAWVLAGRDARCVVVDSLTELHWSMKNDQISVWAPSKIVLDASDRPDGEEIAQLVPWFADLMCASDVLVIGDLHVANARQCTVDTQELTL